MMLYVQMAIFVGEQYGQIKVLMVSVKLVLILVLAVIYIFMPIRVEKEYIAVPDIRLVQLLLLILLKNAFMEMLLAM
jgi:hypothetical protein